MNSQKKQIDISLVNHPTRVFSSKYRPPIAYMYLASYAESKGLSVDIVDIKPSTSGYIHESYQDPDEYALENVKFQIISHLKKTKPLLVGLGCFSVEYKETIELARKIKEQLKDVYIVVGGVHPTIAPDDFIFDNTPIDFVVIGEGEIILSELAERLKNNQDVSNIKGLYGFSNGRIFRNNSHGLVGNLDSLPRPAFNKVDMEYYSSPNPFNIRGVLLSSFLVVGGRGCPYNCTFCASKAMRKLYSGQPFIRLRNVEKIIDEIEFLSNRYSADAFYFLDDTFTMKEDRVYDFCDGLKKRKLNLLWACSTRVNLINEKMLQRMHEAGCIQIDFGVESGSPACLENIKKGITVEQIKTAFKICHKLGIRTLANFMFNIPGETEEDVGATFSLIREIKPSVSMIGIVTPYPGTDIYDTLGPQLTKEELDPNIFKDDRLTIANDKRFRYAKHDLNLTDLQRKANREFNTLGRSLLIFANYKYWWAILKSRRKIDYIKQVSSLAKIWLKQRRNISA